MPKTKFDSRHKLHSRASLLSPHRRLGKGRNLIPSDGVAADSTGGYAYTSRCSTFRADTSRLSRHLSMTSDCCLPTHVSVVSHRIGRAHERADWLVKNSKIRKVFKTTANMCCILCEFSIPINLHSRLVPSSSLEISLACWLDVMWTCVTEHQPDVMMMWRDERVGRGAAARKKMKEC